MTLADLQRGNTSLITHIAEQGENMNRLLELGVIPGARAHMLRTAPLGDPMQVRVDGTLLSIRKLDAAQIQVEHV